MEFNEKLQELRKQKEITQEEFEQMSVKYLNKITDEIAK